MLAPWSPWLRTELLSCRQPKHEAAVEQVPLLVQSLGAVTQDVVMLGERASRQLQHAANVVAMDAGHPRAVTSSRER